VQGFVKALGVKGGALSPTFVVAQTFDGKMPIHHLDFYRMTARELLDIGVDDYLTGRGEIAPGVVLIEWAERCREIWPRERLEIHMRIRPRSTDRNIVIKAKGAHFREIVRRFKQK
jgi:tRNA threonylcarbamoyladenosine biosynthesis protein TsaE